ncbi:50S ribosomal protein L31 [Candidatus Collierbacteria bacterium]|nr:50S ribosomal protein L31 [Candidatus Collierbacteria bacterium]
MKTDIHPQYYPEATITCACGNKFTTGSTKPSILTDVCSACHPFYTGQMKFVDAQGRVEKFQAKMTASSSYRKKQKKTAFRSDVSQKTLKEMLSEAKGRSE